jgi:uncharacterized protein
MLILEKTEEYIFTATGKKFYPFNPKPDDVCIEDIAHALGNQCRFGGHTRRYYSVAEHSYHVSSLCVNYPLWGLLHDAGEAYMIDIPAPIKKHLPGVKEVENKIMEAIVLKFNLEPQSELIYTLPYEVKLYDQYLLNREIDSLIEPVYQEASRFETMSKYLPKDAFLLKFKALTSIKKPYYQ